MALVANGTSEDGDVAARNANPIFTALIRTHADLRTDYADRRFGDWRATAKLGDLAGDLSCLRDDCCWRQSESNDK